MGIIKAVKQAIGGGFADTWQEVIEPDNIGDQTVYARGVLVNRGQNKKGSDDIVSNGSIIHVYDNQFMILVDGGKIVDYTAEPGYYKVSNSSMPSLFNGQFGDSLKETFDRVRFGGQTPQSQKVYYINLQEIKGIKFGTRNPINYYDTFYNAELFLRAHGTYSIKIVNPLQFYAEAIPKNMDHVEITDINEQYLSEFLEALQSAINQMSADGTRISFVTSKASELGRYMAKCSMRAGIRCVVWRYKVLVSPAFHMMRSLRNSSTQETRAQCSQIHLLHRDIWSKICRRVSRMQAATVVEPCRASWVSAWE